MKKKVTQSDIARLAGVSIYTVSCVINHRKDRNVRISNGTRQRVLDVAKSVGYVPNMLAKGLKTRKTYLLAILVPDLTNPFYPFFVRGAQQFAVKQGYHVLVFDSDNSKELELAFIDSICQRWVDGALMYSFHLTPQDIQPLHDAEIPFLDLTGENLNGKSNITNDLEQGIGDLIKYLYEKGHTRIAHIAGPLDVPPGRNRFAAYQRSLQALNIPFDESLVGYGNFTSKGIREIVLTLFQNQETTKRPTALFAANDVMAIEAIESLKSIGYRIPHDVAVCGFDNIPESNVVIPHLTTIDRNSQIIGQQACETILQIINNPVECQPIIMNFSCKLVVRDST